MRGIPVVNHLYRILAGNIPEGFHPASVKMGKEARGCFLPFGKIFPWPLLGKIIGSHTKINAEKNGLLVWIPLIPARLFR